MEKLLLASRNTSLLLPAPTGNAMMSAQEVCVEYIFAVFVIPSQAITRL